jgi:hypothetical protein
VPACRGGRWAVRGAGRLAAGYLVRVDAAKSWRLGMGSTHSDTEGGSRQRRRAGHGPIRLFLSTSVVGPRPGLQPRQPRS